MDSFSIVEISDTSINPETSPELKQIAAVLENTKTTKRRLSDSEDVRRSPKKNCTDIEDAVTAEVIVNESVIDETILAEIKSPAEDGENEFIEPDILDKNISDEIPEQFLIDAEEEDLVEEILNKSDDLLEEQNIEEEEEAEEEEIAEELIPFASGDEEDSTDDEELMARALAASGKHAPAVRFPAIDDDEPIALDDSEEEEIQEKFERPNVNDVSSDFSLDNEVIGDSENEEEEEDEFAALPEKPKKYHLIIAQKLVHRSLTILRTRDIKKAETIPDKEKSPPKTGKVAVCESNNVPAPVEATKDKEKVAAPEEKIANNKPITQPDPEPMDTLDTLEKSIQVAPELPSSISATKIDLETKDAIAEKSPALEEALHKNELNNSEEKIPDQEELTANSQSVDQEKPSADNSNDSSHHETSLLTEISNSSIEEVFSRYVLKANSQSPTLDEFSEELFFCLQLNNKELEKAKQLWNEKLHIKYKIRELMETIRRHRAVMEIETFGLKPESAGNNNHPIISSKSSTTTNSENDDKHFRMSTESVNRLIQDVRATMLKRDDKLRNDDSSMAGDNSLAAQWNSLQANSAQGRQGQIVDVQSIINDFRQKNPQEIPRRGRRMKNSFGHGYYDNQLNDDGGRSSRNEYLSNVTNNSEFSSTMKSNQSGGYPEVSLLPVHNLYKNLSNSSGASGSGLGQFSGQKSSLLQSILTKQSTKSPIGFNQNSALPSTSTLARLLTAPERSFQGLPKHSNQPPPPRRSSTKVHNNGEITITPIGHNDVRNKNFSMEDDENSMEPPLVIDETEDFENNERGKLAADLLCQGCKKNKAFFMCAGCSQQWYCSKECQEMAWDDHAESCMI